VTGLVPKAAKVAGISFERMTSSLVYAAMKRPLDQPRNTAEEPAAPVSAPVPEAAFRPTRAVPGPNPALVKLSRWLFRLALILCAIPILEIGVRGMLDDMAGAWVFLINGLFLLSAEFIFKWFNLLEKKTK